jgi:hypothetical protein
MSHCCSYQRTALQGAVLAVATVLSFVLRTNPLSGFGIHGSDLYTAAFAALPIFAGSVYLENSNIKLFKVRSNNRHCFLNSNEICDFSDTLIVVVATRMLVLYCGLVADCLEENCSQKN